MTDNESGQIENLRSMVEDYHQETKGWIGHVHLSIAALRATVAENDAAVSRQVESLLQGIQAHDNKDNQRFDRLDSSIASLKHRDAKHSLGIDELRKEGADLRVADESTRIETLQALSSTRQERFMWAMGIIAALIIGAASHLIW